MKHIQKILASSLALALGLALMPGAALAVENTVTEVLPCTLELSQVNEFHEGAAVVKESGTNYMKVIYFDGSVVAADKYWTIGNFSEGLAMVEMPEYTSDGNGIIGFNGGYIDHTGKEVIPCQFRNGASAFHEGLAAVGTTDKFGNDGFGYIDKTGKVVIPLQYASAGDFSEGLAVVGTTDEFGNRKYGYIDKTGKMVISFQYDVTVGDFSEGLAAVMDSDGKWGYIDAAGREVVPCKYDSAEAFSGGLAAVAVGGWPNNKWGFIDKTGKEIVPCQYHSVKNFSEGYAAVEDTNYKWGYVDTTGKELVPCKYDLTYGFSEGYAAVRGETGEKTEYGDPICKWGFINETGKEVIPCKYVYGYGYENPDSPHFPKFSNGLAAVAKVSGEKDKAGRDKYIWGYIDITGKEVVPFQYETATNVSEGLAWVEMGGKWGLLGVNMTIATPVVIGLATENVQTVKVDGKDVSFAMYSPDNGGTNYVRLVDLAVALKGTAGQFNVGYDRKLDQVLLTSGEAYGGATSAAPFHSEMEYEMLREPTYVNGEARNLEALRFEYQNGGYTYYKLRDLGQALGFNVGWDKASQRIYIESDKPYDPNN